MDSEEGGFRCRREGRTAVEAGRAAETGKGAHRKPRGREGEDEHLSWLSRTHECVVAQGRGGCHTVSQGHLGLREAVSPLAMHRIQTAHRPYPEATGLGSGSCGRARTNRNGST